jgi:hypothetical protein
VSSWSFAKSTIPGSVSSCSTAFSQSRKHVNHHNPHVTRWLMRTASCGTTKSLLCLQLQSYHTADTFNHTPTYVAVVLTAYTLGARLRLSWFDAVTPRNFSFQFFAFYSSHINAASSELRLHCYLATDKLI